MLLLGQGDVLTWGSNAFGGDCSAVAHHLTEAQFHTSCGFCGVLARCCQAFRCCEHMFAYVQCSHVQVVDIVASRRAFAALRKDGGQTCLPEKLRSSRSARALGIWNESCQELLPGAFQFWVVTAQLCRPHGACRCLQKGLPAFLTALRFLLASAQFELHDILSLHASSGAFAALRGRLFASGVFFGLRGSVVLTRRWRSRCMGWPELRR